MQVQKRLTLLLLVTLICVAFGKADAGSNFGIGWWNGTTLESGPAPIWWGHIDKKVAGSTVELGVNTFVDHYRFPLQPRVIDFEIGIYIAPKALHGYQLVGIEYHHVSTHEVSPVGHHQADIFLDTTKWRGGGASNILSVHYQVFRLGFARLWRDTNTVPMLFNVPHIHYNSSITKGIYASVNAYNNGIFYTYPDNYLVVLLGFDKSFGVKASFGSYISFDNNGEQHLTIFSIKVKI